MTTTTAITFSKRNMATYAQIILAFVKFQYTTTRMISRLSLTQIKQGLEREAAVALIGPRQVGKTTLALELAEDCPCVYLDLEKASDREKLGQTDQFLNLHADKLVILDEVHRSPHLFEILRGVIDEGRRTGKGTGRFLLLGSASIDLMRQSETLAGRIEYIDMQPLHVLELGENPDIQSLWLKGGFPRSLLASTNENSYRWRQNFIQTYLERDVPMFGPRIPPETLRRLWQMLAHFQGTPLNAANLARNIEVSKPSVASYIDLLVGLLLLRRLPPFHANVKKRLVKSPKIYVRDSGLVHALLGIESLDELLGHPVVGMSWEGMVIETLLAFAPYRTTASFYRTATGVEIDLVLDMGAKGLWAIEIKRTTAPKLERGFRQALEDIQPDRAFIVYAGNERYPKADHIEVIGLRDLAKALANP